MLPLNEIAKEVDPRFGDNAITDGPKTFLYLFRRFGPSVYGTDGYKYVCQYYFPLSIPSTYIGVQIDGTSAFWSFTSAGKASSRLASEQLDGSSDFATQCLGHAKEMLAELVRPVSVRDSLITIFGEANADDYKKSAAEYATSSGFGVPRAWIVLPELCLDFMRWVEKQAGNGDPALAMSELMMEGSIHDQNED